MPAKYGKPSGQSSTPFSRLQETLKWVDLVFEVLDARAPKSSRHPNAEKIFSHKPRLVVMCKEDLADPAFFSYWLKHAAMNEGDESPVDAMSLSLKTQKSRDKILGAAIKVTADRREALRKRGLMDRPMRACVVGMPNVGKSSLINWLIGKNKAKVGNKPGVTRGPQWVRVHPQIELLDTPGFLPSVNFSEEVFLKLAVLNLVPANTYDAEHVARLGLGILKRLYPHALEGYMCDGPVSDATLEGFSSRRNFLTNGGNPDVARAAITFLTDLRNGKLGRVTLDQPAEDI
jgi:ribosome biogenesis GTPase A